MRPRRPANPGNIDHRASCGGWIGLKCLVHFPKSGLGRVLLGSAEPASFTNATPSARRSGWAVHTRQFSAVSNCERQRAAHRALDKESEWTRAPPWRSKVFFASARVFAELSLSYAVQNNDGAGAYHAAPSTQLEVTVTAAASRGSRRRTRFWAGKSRSGGKDACHPTRQFGHPWVGLSGRPSPISLM
jgi:hypothetical protein